MESLGRGRLLCWLIVINSVHISIETIPLSLARRLNAIKSNEEFLQLFVHNRPTTGRARQLPQAARLVQDAPNFEPEVLQKMVASAVPENEGCIPRGTPVPVPDDADPMYFYWPQCINVSRCGGCCNGGESFTCKPTSTATATFRVWRVSHDDSQLPSTVEIQLESHRSCECGCRTVASDCNPLTQRYDAGTCSCLCINVTACASPKSWDASRCQCVCPSTENCGADEYFNPRSCVCVKIPAHDDVAPPRDSAVFNPCLRYHCRPGLVPKVVNGQCVCTLARRSWNRDPLD